MRMTFLHNLILSLILAHSSKNNIEIMMTQKHLPQNIDSGSVSQYLTPDKILYLNYTLILIHIYILHKGSPPKMNWHG